MLLVSLEMNPVISIHAPRTGSDERVTVRLTHTSAFQSTLPARGATRRSREPIGYKINFNPRSPHGERRHRSFRLWQQSGISIHAPRTGSDLASRPHHQRRRNFNPRSPHGERRTGTPSGRAMCAHFNPRSPHGERRSAGFERRAVGSISIHAPRTGSDTSPEKADEYAKNFNPRSPHGERRAQHRVR